VLGGGVGACGRAGVRVVACVEGVAVFEQHFASATVAQRIVGEGRGREAGICVC
jgi:hypothetical protein